MTPLGALLLLAGLVSVATGVVMLPSPADFIAGGVLAMAVGMLFVIADDS